MSSLPEDFERQRDAYEQTAQTEQLETLAVDTFTGNPEAEAFVRGMLQKAQERLETVCQCDGCLLEYAAWWMFAQKMVSLSNQRILDAEPEGDE